MINRTANAPARTMTKRFAPRALSSRELETRSTEKLWAPERTASFGKSSVAVFGASSSARPLRMPCRLPSICSREAPGFTRATMLTPQFSGASNPDARTDSNASGIKNPERCPLRCETRRPSLRQSSRQENSQEDRFSESRWIRRQSPVPEAMTDDNGGWSVWPIVADAERASCRGPDPNGFEIIARDELSRSSHRPHRRSWRRHPHS